MYKIHLTLKLALLACFAHAQDPQQSLIQFSNGRSFDVDGLLKALNVVIPDTTITPPQGNDAIQNGAPPPTIAGFQAPPTPPPPQPAGFSAADRISDQDRRNQNFRTIFSQSLGNEFVSSQNASNSANNDQQQLSILVDQTGIDTQVSFDADGNPTDEGVARISQRRESTCVFDRPNREACNFPFREATGRCSNLMEGRKTWGMAGTPFTRVLSPLYEDGVRERRRTAFSSSTPLKPAREISTLVTRTDVILNREGFTSQIMQWGQYIAHEFTQLGEEDHVECCPDAIFEARFGAGQTPTRAQLAEIRREVETNRGDVCQQIEVENDTTHGGYVCMNHIRSTPAPLHDCAIGPRQQMNAVTHVLDGSVVYGSSQADQNKLREHRGGLMKTQTVNGFTLAPPDLDNCPANQRSINRCPFLGGDSRINTTPNLASLHTVAVLKHNQIARELAGINPQWDDERIFQETRRIVAGIEANVHVYEYLPLVIGQGLINRYRLDAYTGHETTTNPSTLSELAGAAFRFGHSTIDGFFTLIKDDNSRDFVNLRDHFFNNNSTYESGIAPNVKGLMNDDPWIVDRNFPNQMRDFLFDKELDIVSLNINRGRDHGFQSYVAYRRHYGLSVPRSWSDLSSTHPAETIAQLRLAYDNVNDIELYIGGVTENHANGALVGELFGNIIGDGFSRLQRGDRFYFESPHSGLSQQQIAAIKSYKYSQFLCEGAGLQTISDNAYIRAGRLGATEVQCSSFTPLNLSLWKEDIVHPVCEWQVVDTGECCFGRRQISRQCTGAPGCSCPGPSTITEECRCDGWHCYINLWQRCKNAWSFNQ